MSSKPSESFVDTTIERIVVDSSVAVKWFLEDEPDIDLANNILTRSFKKELELHAPHIFTHEVDGALTRACLTRFERGGPPRMTVEAPAEPPVNGSTGVEPSQFRRIPAAISLNDKVVLRPNTDLGIKFLVPRPDRFLKPVRSDESIWEIKNRNRYKTS